jgi:AcrR family transcriptional regulator
MNRTPAAESRSRLGLSRETIVQQAAQLIVEQGLKGLTMRRVAEALGIGTMTLYGYFRDKDELLDAVIDFHSSRQEIPRSSGPWKARMRKLMLALHHQLVEHPFLVELRLRRPLASPGAFRWTEAGLEILKDAGLSSADAARAFRPLFIYTFGHAIFLPREDPDRVVREAHAAIMLLAPEQYPIVTAAAAELATSLVAEESYQQGLNQQLDGIEAQLGA